MSTLKVRDLMTASVRTLNESDSALAAYDMMDELHIRHVPVLNGDGEVVGLVTDRDLLRHAMNGMAELPMSAQRSMLREVKLKTIMTNDPQTVEPDTDVSEAGSLLMEHKFGCLPVIEGDGLVGILTEADFVRHVVSEA